MKTTAGTKMSRAVMMIMMIMTGCKVRAQFYDHPHVEYKSDHHTFEEETSSHQSRGRQLSTFIPLETRYTTESLSSSVDDIRVKLVWDLVDDAIDNPDESDTNKQMDPSQCRESGQTVDPAYYEYGGSSSYTCADADVVSADGVTFAKEHGDWVIAYLASAVKVLSRNDSIVLDASAQENYNWDKGGTRNTTSSWTHTNVDLVVVMTLHKSNNGVAGYFSCHMRDTLGRCIMGYFNWCPDQININLRLSADQIQSDRRTFLHEVLHGLGCCSGDNFVDNTGLITTAAQTDAVYSTSLTTYTKTVRFLQSPKVMTTLQRQWSCDSIQGAPLEDIPLGVGSHWEARVLGPEVMAYGSGSGESYVSDLTWAYLEDSGHYIVARNYTVGNQYTANNNELHDNYTYAAGGRLLESEPIDWSTGYISQIAELFGWTTEKHDGTAVVRSPGYLRWGRHKGCDFFEGFPKNVWSETEMYMTCTGSNTAGCTADRRMSATCVLKEWGAGGGSVNDPYTCVGTSSSCTSNAQSPNLPTEMRTFDSANTGGYNDAMDYVPAMVGYWNCLDEKPLSTSTSAVVGNTSLDFSSLFDVLATDLDSFGGQQHGTEARCFESTLREFGSVLSLSFENYGLCYIANCYTTDYLQVGIRGRDGGTDWYGCPKEGGSLFLAGFSGSLKCPSATEFCAQEDISGVYYTEATNWAAWLIVGVIVGIPVLIILILCCFKKPRDKCTLFTKVLCGFELDPDERLAYERINARRKIKTNQMFGIEATETNRRLAAIDSRAMRVFRFKVNRALVRRHTCHSRTLFYINATWQVIGSVMFMFGLIAIGGIPAGCENVAPLAITASIFILGCSALGCSGLTAGRPTLKLLVYFYISLFMASLMILGLITFLSSPEYITDTANSQWLTYRLYFPDSYHTLTRSEAEDKFESDVGFSMDYMWIGTTTFVTLSCVLGVYCAAMTLRFKNLMQNIFMLFNLGGVLVYACFTISYGSEGFQIEDFFDDWVYVLLILLGAFLALVVAIGTVGDWTKSGKILSVYHALSIIGALSMLVLGACIYADEDGIRTRVADLDSENKAKLAEVLNVESTTEDELVNMIVAVLLLYAMASIILAIILALLSFVSRYIVALHIARKKLLSDWAKQCREAEESGRRAPIAPDVSFANIMSSISSNRIGEENHVDAFMSGGVPGSHFPAASKSADVVMSPDAHLPRALAVEIDEDDVIDGMEFPPPPASPQGGRGSFAAPDFRPHPVPPVGPRPPPRRNDHDAVALPVAAVIAEAEFDEQEIHSL